MSTWSSSLVTEAEADRAAAYVSTWSSSSVTEAEADRERLPVCPRGRRWLQKLRLTESGRLCVHVDVGGYRS